MEIPNVFKHLNEAMRTNKDWELDMYKDQVEELKQKDKLLETENKRLRNELKETRAELANMIEEEFKICSGCAGAGDVRQTAKSTDIEESWIKCEECLGEGKVLK